MLEIEIQRENLVAPAEETPRETLWLSNIDLVISRIHLPTVYFFRPNESSDFFEPSILREALAKALVPFYPMAGRLQRNSKSGKFEIDCNAAGLLFVEARANATIDEYAGDFAPNPLFLRLMPPVDYTRDLANLPLVVLQVTFFECGGVSLGCGMEHRLVDGISGISFMKAWSSIARGVDPSAIRAPFLDRALLKARNPPMPRFPHVEYHPPPVLLSNSDIPNGKENLSTAKGHVANGGKVNSNPNSDLNSNADSNSISAKQQPKLEVGMFRLSREKIQALKAQATDGQSGTTYSSYEMLSAHIWRCVCESRGLEPDQETKLYIATDGRDRLIPPLPKNYFGNTIFTCTPISTARNLTSKPLYSTAGVIHRAVKRMDDEYLRSSVDYLEAQPDLEKLVRSANTYKSPNLGITSWGKLPMYEVDFGWGKPAWMGPAIIAFEGLAYVLPSPTGDGSFPIALGLHPECMPVFRKLIMQI